MYRVFMVGLVIEVEISVHARNRGLQGLLARDSSSGGVSSPNR